MLSRSEKVNITIIISATPVSDIVTHTKYAIAKLTRRANGAELKDSTGSMININSQVRACSGYLAAWHPR